MLLDLGPLPQRLAVFDIVGLERGSGCLASGIFDEVRHSLLQLSGIAWNSDGCGEQMRVAIRSLMGWPPDSEKEEVAVVVVGTAPSVK